MKVLYVTPNSTDPLALYRGTGPLFRMRQDIPNFDYTDLKQISWADVVAHDVVFMQRPYTPEHLQILGYCKRFNVPLIVDFDDWLLDLAESNPAYAAFNQTKQFVIEITKQASAVVVATQKLKELHEKIGGKNVHVIPNAYDSRLYPYRKNEMDRNRIFLWRGGNSHMEDLMSVKDAYEDLMKKHKEWQFVFIAQRPWFFPKLPNIHFVEGCEAVDYFRRIHDLCPAIMTHPLTDTEFNRAKSMCSWIEATHARAAFIGPDFEEFKRPGVLNYRAGDQQSFFDTCDALISNKERLVPNMRLSEAEILGPLELRDVNAKRYELLKSLM